MEADPVKECLTIYALWVYNDVAIVPNDGR
jgi:hypothetical protein